MERECRNGLLTRAASILLLSLVTPSFFLCFALAQPDVDASGQDNTTFSPDLLSIPRTFNFVQHGPRCIRAIAPSETIEYVPPSSGIQEDNSVPASSFIVRGALCDTAEEAVYQLSAEVPPNGSMFESIQAIVGEPDEFNGLYFFGNLKFDRKRRGPLCQRKTKDLSGAKPRDATLQKFMVASISESFSPKSDETLVPSLNKGSVYLLAIVRFVDNGYVNQLCIFESSTPSEGRSANSDAVEGKTSDGDDETKESGKSSNLSKASVAGIIVGTVFAVAIGAAIIISLCRRFLRRHRNKDSGRSDSTAEGTERTQDVYDTLDLGVL